MDSVGKVFAVEGLFRRCLVCDGLFTIEASKEHAVAICFPKPDSSESKRGNN